MKEVLKSFIPLFITVTCLSLLVFICCQQIYRLSANDPQIQMAEDAKIYLSGGGSYSFTDQNKTEMSQSLAPFLMLYDKDKKLISYSAVLHGNPPVLPVGVLDNAKKKGETRARRKVCEGGEGVINVNCNPVALLPTDHTHNSTVDLMTSIHSLHYTNH
jgi:hypothetical protein